MIAVVRATVAAIAAITGRNARTQRLAVRLRYTNTIRTAVHAVTRVRIRHTTRAVVRHAVRTSAGRLAPKHLALAATAAVHPIAGLVDQTLQTIGVMAGVALARSHARVANHAIAVAGAQDSVAHIGLRIPRRIAIVRNVVGARIDLRTALSGASGRPS